MIIYAPDFYVLSFCAPLPFIQDMQPLPPPEKTKEDIILFFKLYDPIREELRYVSSCLVPILHQIYWHLIVCHAVYCLLIIAKLH